MSVSLPAPPPSPFRYDHTFELYSDSDRLYLFGTDDPESHREWVKSLAKVSSDQGFRGWLSVRPSPRSLHLPEGLSHVAVDWPPANGRRLVLKYYLTVAVEQILPLNSLIWKGKAKIEASDSLRSAAFLHGRAHHSRGGSEQDICVWLCTCTTACCCCCILWWQGYPSMYLNSP